jgi:hypothetical protein
MCGRHRPTGTRSWLLRRPRPRVCPLLPFWVTNRALVEPPAAPVSLHSESGVVVLVAAMEVRVSPAEAQEPANAFQSSGLTTFSVAYSWPK